MPITPQSARSYRYVLAEGGHIVLVTALFLALVVHWLLVKMAQVRPISSCLAWQQVAFGTAGGSVGGRDEVRAPAAEVNGLITVIETQVKELTIQSMTDPLTGLPNPRAFTCAWHWSFRGRSGRGRRLRWRCC